MEAELKDLLLVQRLSFSWITAKMGRNLSRSAVIGKANRMGWKKPVRAAPAKPSNKKPGVTVHGSLEAEPLPLPTLEDDAIPRQQLCTLLELQFHHCRYPIERDGETLFCAAAQKSDSSYCEYHHCICHRPVPARRSSIWIDSRKIAA